MKGDRIPVQVLAARVIGNLSPALLARLGGSGRRAAAILSTDCDDATYIALDEATKRANVEVVYARSLYAGAANASTALAGEVIAVLAGENPEEVRSGLEAALETLQTATFRWANDAENVPYLAHTVARTGSFLSQQAGVAPGQAIAYLVAPPTEAIVAIDAALKAADVAFGTFYQPPTETNFAGALLTGSRSACAAACEAFARSVEQTAAHPTDGREKQGLFPGPGEILTAHKEEPWKNQWN